MDWDHEQSLKKLGYIVRFYRRHKEMTQIEMASALDVSPRNLQRFERGLVEPKLRTLIQISRLVDIPLSNLLRPTDEKTLFQLHSTQDEYGTYKAISAEINREATDLRFAKRMIELDRIDDANIRPEMFAQLDGNIAHLSPEMQNFIGVTTEKCDFQPFVIHGSAVERWELVFRLKLRSAIMENALCVPTGLKFVREHHVRLNPNPENPTSEVYFLDITDRRNLEEWVKSRQRIALF